MLTSLSYEDRVRRERRDGGEARGNEGGRIEKGSRVEKGEIDKRE